MKSGPEEKSVQIITEPRKEKAGEKNLASPVLRKMLTQWAWESLDKVWKRIILFKQLSTNFQCNYYFSQFLFFLANIRYEEAWMEKMAPFHLSGMVCGFNLLKKLPFWKMSGSILKLKVQMKNNFIFKEIILGFVKILYRYWYRLFSTSKGLPRKRCKEHQKPVIHFTLQCFKNIEMA